MIALTLGLMILLAVGTVFISSRQSFSTQEAMARMQEGARYAFELMSVDIRQAGFTDCAPKSNTYSTLAGTDWFNTLATQPLLGYESGAGLPADVTNALANTDALKILRADNSGDYRIDSHAPASAQFQLAANHDLKQGEILTVVDADCSKAVVFQQSNVNNNNTIDVVVHNTGVGTPGNSTKCLDDPAGALCASPATYPALGPNSRIMRMSGNIYYLRNNPAGEPALYRKRANTAAEELVEGVENMQITYGEDTTQVSVATCPEDGCSANAYFSAGAVTDWNRVVSVRLTLSMRTPSTQAGVGGDGRIRKTFTTTIAVRNRL
jgi:type IV pilus assembly protein PilW